MNELPDGKFRKNFLQGISGLKSSLRGNRKKKKKKSSCIPKNMQIQAFIF